MNTTLADAPAALPVTSGGRAAWLEPRPPRRGLVVALVASLAAHLAFSLWPAEMPETPDVVPLQATITEMPPPPAPAPVAQSKPRPRPRRATAPPQPAPAPVAAPEATGTPAPEPAEGPATEPTAEAIAAGPEAPTEVVPVEPAVPAPGKSPDTLPRRVDLVYKAYLGTHGFLIGEAVYRFEHTSNEYAISTVGEAKGLAALFIRGQGRVESRGLITPTGLRPLEFVVERGSRERRETALFDWESGIVTLFEQKTAALDLATFDPLTLMWQAYFSPPVEDTQTVSVATTRRVGRYTIVREGVEKLPWNDGEIDTERWHRRSEDGATDAIMWLAPSLHYIPLKVRVTATNRGTVEAALDSIRVDEPIARQ